MATGGRDVDPSARRGARSVSEDDGARRSRGATSLGDGGGGRRRGLGWLWGLLALLLVAALVILLISLLGGDDDDESARTGQTTTQAGQATDQAAPAAGSATEGGTLTAEGTSLLPVPGGGLESYVGDNADGRGVTVQKVVEQEGFFVGTSAQDRVYVEYGGDVGEDERQFAPTVGDRVDLTGPVRPAPEDPAQTLKLDAEDAKTVSDQGGYINADSAQPAA